MVRSYSNSKVSRKRIMKMVYTPYKLTIDFLQEPCAKIKEEKEREKEKSLCISTENIEMDFFHL
jgi:O-succinylbenzoate synthase